MATWLYLASAIGLELGGAWFMKQSARFTKPLPSVLMFGFFAASIAALNLAARQIGIGIAYAVWAGLATSLITALGYYVYGEPITRLQLLAIGLIVIGVILLNVSPQQG